VGPLCAGLLLPCAGRPLPDDVRGRLEQLLTADFSAVQIHEGAAASNMGAVAGARGTDCTSLPDTPATLPVGGSAVDAVKTARSCAPVASYRPSLTSGYRRFCGPPELGIEPRRGHRRRCAAPDRGIPRGAGRLRPDLRIGRRRRCRRWSPVCTIWAPARSSSSPPARAMATTPSRCCRRKASRSTHRSGSRRSISTLRTASKPPTMSRSSRTPARRRAASCRLTAARSRPPKRTRTSSRPRPARCCPARG
jgi:hypothetical protein